MRTCMYQVYKYEMTIWETDGAPMQCEVQRFNIIRHFIVPSTSVKQSDLIEKCLHSCVAVFNMMKFIPNKEHSRTALIFCFHLKKLLRNHTDYLEKLMVNMLHRKKQ